MDVFIDLGFWLIVRIVGNRFCRGYYHGLAILIRRLDEELVASDYLF